MQTRARAVYLVRVAPISDGGVAGAWAMSDPMTTQGAAEEALEVCVRAAPRGCRRPTRRVCGARCVCVGVGVGGSTAEEAP